MEPLGVVGVIREIATGIVNKFGHNGNVRDRPRQGLSIVESSSANIPIISSLAELFAYYSVR
jgi:hypothetical protein